MSIGSGLRAVSNEETGMIRRRAWVFAAAASALLAACGGKSGGEDAEAQVDDGPGGDEADDGAGDGTGDATNDDTGDSDALPLCGNNRIDPGETCDPPATCPASCDDGDACTTDQMTGSASACNVLCTHPSIEGCEETFGAEPNPTGNPIGGGPGYRDIVCETDTDGDYRVSTGEELLDALALAESGEVICIAGDAVIDLTGTPNNVIPAGVTLASDRGAGGSQGALIRYTYNDNGMYMTSIFVVGGDGVRVTGLRLEGEMFPEDGTGNGESSYLVGIKADSREGDMTGLEVDNCEMAGFAWSCVTTLNVTNVNIHHNSMHHCQARGEGYGYDIYGGNALVEANIFDFNRHDIAAGGYPGESYEARYNIVRPSGHPIGSHHFDVHACNPNDYSDDSEIGPDFIAGDLYRIHHNTFEPGGGQQACIGIRSRPVTGAYIDHNDFMGVTGDTEGGVPIWQRAYAFGNMFVTDNYWNGTLYAGDEIVWYYHPY